MDVPVVSQEILDDDPVVADLLEAAHGRIECMEGNSEAYEEQRPVRESSAEERRVAAVSRPSRGAVAGRQFKFGSCPTHGCARSAHVFSVDAASERRGRAFVICNLWWKYDSCGRRKCWHMEAATAEQFRVFPKMLKEKYSDLRVSLARGAAR